ncbi:MAG: LptF/LptG family permease [Elusimicrobiales bacterium]
MKILYRYIASKFWGPFFFGLGVFSALVFLTDIFDHMSAFSKTSAPTRVIFNYFAHSLPFWSLMIVPVAALLAELFCVSELIASGEWTAGVSSGYRPRQLAAPVIACCALVCAAHFALTETVSPSLRRRAEFIYEREISGNKNYHQEIKKDIAARASEGVFLSAAELDIASGEMKTASYTRQDAGRAKFQAEAPLARWQPRTGRWMFFNGTQRTFSPEGGVEVKKFDSWDSGVDIEPQLISADKIWPEDVTVSELLRRIKVLKRTGSSRRREEVFLHFKLAAPWVNLFLCLTALPFAVKVRRAGKMLHFTAAIALAFVFWWTASIARSAGEAGMLSPAVSAWLPAAAFGASAFFLVRKSGL